ncbi:unnamed protein product [Prorocentrum cordatum]|uniref:CCHC-type domain-containing protein n=1 Tax=Prorocentrum cordatum TaxID=2364126 RepID=A0ABN9U296_9DINO|nr:unnamed protein product [Polarella glacialis]
MSRSNSAGSKSLFQGSQPGVGRWARSDKKHPSNRSAQVPAMFKDSLLARRIFERSQSKNIEHVQKRIQSLPMALRNSRSKRIDKIYTVLDDPASSKVAWWTAKALQAVVLLSVLVTYLQIVEDPVLHGWSAAVIESVFDFVFLAEVCVRFSCAPNRVNFFFSTHTWIDIAAASAVVVRVAAGLVLPVSLDDMCTILLLGIVPIVRLLKIIRHFETFNVLIQAVRITMEALPMLLYAVTLITLIFANLIYFMELRGSETKDSATSPSDSEGAGFTEQQLATLLKLIGESSRHQFQELKDELRNLSQQGASTGPPETKTEAVHETEGAGRHARDDPWAQDDPWGGRQEPDEQPAGKWERGTSWGGTREPWWQSSDGKSHGYDGNEKDDDDGQWTWRGHDWSSSSWSWHEKSWSKPDYSDPDPWMGWTGFRIWRRKIKRWLSSTDVPIQKRSDKLLKTLDLELQRKMEDISDDVLMSSVGPDMIVKRLDTMSGKRVDDEDRRAARECLFGYQRKAGETLSMYAARMEQQFDLLRAQGLPLPDKWMHLFMEEGVNLDDSGKQMLRVLTRGSGKYEDLQNAIRELDLSKTESLSGAARAARTYLGEDEEGSGTYHGEQDDESELSVDTDMENEILLCIDSADIDEDQAPLVLAELQQVTRCKKCRKKGHWSRECPENKQSSTNGFVFLNEPSADASGLVLATLSEVVKRCEEALRSLPSQATAPDIFLTTEGGKIIVDTAAAQGVMQIDLVNQELPVWIATNQPIPEGIAKREFRWAALASRSLMREETLGANLLTMSVTGRLFPQDWPRRMRTIDSRQLECRHPLDQEMLLGNRHAKWHKCGSCALRLSYESTPILKGESKAPRQCPPVTRPSARRARGTAQGILESSMASTKPEAGAPFTPTTVRGYRPGPPMKEYEHMEVGALPRRRGRAPMEQAEEDNLKAQQDMLKTQEKILEMLGQVQGQVATQGAALATQQEAIQCLQAHTQSHALVIANATTGASQAAAAAASSGVTVNGWQDVSHLSPAEQIQYVKTSAPDGPVTLNLPFPGVTRQWVEKGEIYFETDPGTLFLIGPNLEAVPAKRLS